MTPKVDTKEAPLAKWEIVRLLVALILPVSTILAVGIAWGVLNQRVDAQDTRIEEIQRSQAKTDARLDLIDQRLMTLSSNVAGQQALQESIDKKVDYILQRVDQLATP